MTLLRESKGCWVHYRMTHAEGPKLFSYWFSQKVISVWEGMSSSIFLFLFDGIKSKGEWITGVLCRPVALWSMCQTASQAEPRTSAQVSPNHQHKAASSQLLLGEPPQGAISLILLLQIKETALNIAAFLMPKKLGHANKYVSSYKVISPSVYIVIVFHSLCGFYEICRAQIVLE